MRVVFVEDRRQVAAAPVDAETTLVAVTAEALEAADASGVPCRAIGEFGAPSVLGRLERDFVVQTESLLDELERETRAQLTDQDYNAVVTVQALATRGWLMREVVRALRPERAAVFDTTDETWFAATSYRTSPWALLLTEIGKAEGVEVELLRAAPAGVPAEPVPTGRRPTIAALLRAAARRIGRVRARDGASSRTILFVGAPSYDWAPVVRRLRTRYRVAWVDLDFLEPGHDWTAVLGTTLASSSGDARALAVSVDPRATDDLVGDAVAAAAAGQRLEIDGLDVLPALLPNLVDLARRSGAIAAHTDAVVAAALGDVAPDVVCLPSITLQPQKRAAELARAAGIPVVAYQHGGAYSTHEWAPHDLADWGHADWFLTYGDGVTPPPTPVAELRARFLPVGSARLAGWRPRRRRGTVRRVAWVAEASTRNWINYSLLEDTERYLLEREALERLARGGVAASYRPYPGQAERSGVVAWLRRAQLPNVELASTGPLRRVLERADAVVSDGASGTVWLEALALRIPFVLYVDPVAARLRPEVAADLAAACALCTTREELFEALDRLAAGEAPAVDLDGLERFLSRYVLGAGDPVGAAVAAVEQIATER